MSDYERYALVLEMVIQGLIPNAHPQALGKIDDVIHDLALDWEAFGIWFDNQIRKDFHRKKQYQVFVQAMKDYFIYS